MEWPEEPPGGGRGSQGNEHGHEHCCMHLLSCWEFVSLLAIIYI